MIALIGSIDSVTIFSPVTKLHRIMLWSTFIQSKCDNYVIFVSTTEDLHTPDEVRQPVYSSVVRLNRGHDLYLIATWLPKAARRPHQCFFFNQAC